MEDTSDSDITLKITGHQWKWEYEYLNEGVKFFSNLHADSREAATQPVEPPPTMITS